MRTREPHGIRNAVLLGLFLLGCGTLANRYIADSGLRGQNRVIAGNDSSQQLMGSSATSFLPTRFLDGETVSISRERNVSVLKSVFEVFDPALRPFLASVPIVLDFSADTAKAYPTKGYIGVSPDWDNTVLQSRFKAIYARRGMKSADPVFINRFKTDLLIHEYLHILQIHLGIDDRLFYAAVARWYIDPRYGMPSHSGMVNTDKTNDRKAEALAINRMKYVLWHALYNYRNLNDLPQDESWKNMQYAERYRLAEKGVEEFAYIGQEVLASGSGSENFIKTGQWYDQDWQSKKLRLLEISPELIAVFRGVFSSEVMP